MTMPPDPPGHASVHVAPNAHIAARWSTAAIDAEGDRRLEAALARAWRVPRGVAGLFCRTDHRSTGRRFIITALAFFAAGGLLALLMRLQLARADNRFIGPDLYDQIFTMHGSTMMFLFAVPIMLGMGIYLVPLMIGARDIAFPRLVAFGYYMFLFGGLFLYIAFLLNIGPDTGWFTYLPLSSPQYSPGKRVDIWAQLINFTELSALVVAVPLIVTILKLRAPGMTLARMPLFVWAMLVTSFMVIFAMPAIMTASLFLATDRLVATQFYNPAEGGDALLWQHLFWFFGHPEVYIIFLPALGMVSSIVSACCQRPIFGYTAMVLSMVATGFLAFGLWVHHMFATPLPQMGQSFFTAASILIAIPSGVQIFCWIATIWNGRVRFDTPMLFVLAFVVTFVAGGLTGVMLGAVPLDLQVHDTFFVVAHLHYVLIGGSVFPLFGGLYFWFPKLTGRMLGERLGRWNAALFFVGFHLTFYPMHHLGLAGMPRRVYTYSAGLGWDRLNLLATIGAGVLGVAVLTFVANVVLSLARGTHATRNPWHAGTLEWQTPSPPPTYNFLHVPVVRAREPVWEDERQAHVAVVAGLRSDRREVLVTTVVDARPDCRTEFPEPSVWPLLTALVVSAMFVGALFTPWAIVYGGIAGTVTMIGWFWPRNMPPRPERTAVPPPQRKEATA